VGIQLLVIQTLGHGRVDSAHGIGAWDGEPLALAHEVHVVFNERARIGLPERDQHLVIRRTGNGILLGYAA